MAFGQSNAEENNSKEVIRVVKYDKGFNRLESASVTGGESFTIEPFEAGSLRMAESGNELVIHTTRKRYTTGSEASGSNYLVAISSIDHSKVASCGSFNMTGLDRDERDVALLVCGKNGGGTRQVRLTDYVGKNKLGSTPYLVKLSEDRFLVLWEEFAYGESNGSADPGVRYVEVDGAGNALTEVRSLQNARRSSDCQAVLLDGAVTWYVNMKAGRIFYQIEG